MRICLRPPSFYVSGRRWTVAPLPPSPPFLLAISLTCPVINTGTDYEGYMLSVNHFVEKGGQLRDSCLIPGSLGAASFWVGLRQEIYVAVVTQREVRLRLVGSLVNPLRYFEATDDHTWANRAVLHCAEVLNFVYDPHSPHRRDELRRWNELWEHSLPKSYDPIFQEDGAKYAFPAIWYRQSCHGTFFEFDLGGKRLIFPSDRCAASSLGPTFHPELGQHRAMRIWGQDSPAGEFSLHLFGRALTAWQEQIQPLVRKICGIGLGNQWTPPSVFTACMAISACKSPRRPCTILALTSDMAGQLATGSRTVETRRR